MIIDTKHVETIRKSDGPEWIEVGREQLTVGDLVRFYADGASKPLASSERVITWRVGALTDDGGFDVAPARGFGLAAIPGPL